MTVVDTMAHEYGWRVEEVLDLTIARTRSLMDAAMGRRKGDFRRQIALTEWSTQLIATAALAGPGQAKKEQIASVGKERFPWVDSEDEKKKLAEGDDLSFLETGDLSAADRNAGRNLGLLGMSH